MIASVVPPETGAWPAPGDTARVVGPGILRGKEVEVIGRLDPTDPDRITIRFFFNGWPIATGLDIGHLARPRRRKH